MQARITFGGVAAVALAAFLSAGPATAQTPTVTLGEAIDLALRVQPGMVQARGQVTTASATKRQALGNWLPSLSVGSGFSSNSVNRFDQENQRVTVGSSTAYSANISTSLVLFDGLTRLYNGKAASADALAADASLVNQRFQTVLQVKQAYFSALAAEELDRVSDRQIERATEQLDVSREKLAAGTATRSDTLRSSVEVANARLQKLNAVTQLAIAGANLARLIGFDGTVRTVFEDRLLEIAVIDTAAVRLEALAQSPAIYQADAQANAAQAQFNASFGQYLPSISASYSRTWAGTELITDWNPAWSLRLSASWPLFNGFSRELNRTRSAVARDNQRAVAQDTRRQVNAQITQYVTSLAAAEIRLEIALANRIANDEDLRVQQERYRLGAATILDVLVSQVGLDQSEVDIIQARLDYLVAKAEIEAVIGREL
jgi:outer membrane protein TolC